MKNISHQKGFIVSILIGIIIFMILIGGVYLYKNKKVEAPVVINENTPTIIKDENLKTFKLGELEFSYPDKLILSESKDLINLSHILNKKHINSCDLKDGLEINSASDFGVSFSLKNSDLKSLIKEDNSNMIEYIFKGDSIVTEKDSFVSKYKIGALDGYKISTGVEGCGYSTYYFPISTNETLVVKRNFYLETLQVGRDELVNMPGFISENQEEQIFKDILSSIKGLK